MYRKYYPNYLISNIFISIIFIGLAMYPENLQFNYCMVILQWIIGIGLMHFLIIRLPIFNQFYINRSKLKAYVLKSRKHDSGEYRVAPVMSGLVVFVLISAILYLFKITEFFVEYAFISALSAGNMSFYYIRD